MSAFADAFKRLARGALATVVGLLGAGLVVAGVEMLGHRVYPVPAELALDSREAMAAYVASLPVGAILFVLLAWVLGTLVGGVIAVAIARRRPRLYAGIIAALILVGAGMNFSMIPHPSWFMLLSVVCIPLAGLLAAMLGARLIGRPAKAI
jgi:pimeloyl-ACP methyl ester carboxylesterase